jgi:hypothetical protein
LQLDSKYPTATTTAAAEYTQMQTTKQKPSNNEKAQGKQK